MKDLFLFNQNITFLNHGSFGACPTPIFDDYRKWQLKLEQNPVQFITKEGPKQLALSRAALAQYINCHMDDLVYMTSPSTAMNTVIRSISLKEGDEVLTTDQEYGPMDRTWEYYCKQSGATYKRQSIPLPLTTKEDFLTAFWSGLTSKTKVVFLSHITSQTALIFPIKEICIKAKELGIKTIIDGAHVPGHIPLDILDIDPDIYTGACHKWMLTPKGNSFLYVKREIQESIDPLIISWGYKSTTPSHSKFLDYHEFCGTRDFSAFLTTPVAINFLKEYNWENEKEKCRSLLKYYYPIIAKQLNSITLAPLDDSFLGQMSSIPIKTNKPTLLKETLFDNYKIEIPIITVPEGTYLRVSFQAYNDEKEIEILLDALKDIKQKTNLLI